MTETILVPIDFRVASLNTLKLALESCSGRQVQVVLMYAETVDDSISELLFYTPDKKIKDLTTPEFKEALEVLKNRFEGTIAGGIIFRLFHGRTAAAFFNFAKANGIDTVFIPKTYPLALPLKAFDPTPLIRKSAIPFREVGWEIGRTATEQEQIITLFT